MIHFDRQALSRVVRLSFVLGLIATFALSAFAQTGVRNLRGTVTPATAANLYTMS